MPGDRDGGSIASSRPRIRSARSTGLTGRPVARGAHVVVKQGGRPTQQVPPPLVEGGPITGEPECDVEDPFDPAFYLNLVNRAYAKDLDGTPLPLADLPKKAGRITKNINATFAKRKIAGGVLNHYRPAAVLLRNQADLVPAIDEATRERFSMLAERVNRVR